MTAFIQFNKGKIKSIQNPDFHQKFSSLFEELNPSFEGFSIYYYSVYTSRRLAFLLFQLFLDQNYAIQFGAHIIGSILCLIYYIKLTKLKDKDSQVILIASESIILITFFSIFLINFTQSQYWNDFITSVVMYSLIGFIGFEGLIEIYKFFKSFRDLVNRFKVKRKAKFNLAISLGNSE